MHILNSTNTLKRWYLFIYCLFLMIHQAQYLSQQFTPRCSYVIKLATNNFCALRSPWINIPSCLLLWQIRTPVQCVHEKSDCCSVPLRSSSTVHIWKCFWIKSDGTFNCSVASNAAAAANAKPGSTNNFLYGPLLFDRSTQPFNECIFFLSADSSI